MPKKAGTVKDLTSKQKKIEKDALLKVKNEKTKKKMANIKKVADNYKSETRKKAITKALRDSIGITSTKHYVAWNPTTKTEISGTISQLAKKLKSAPNTIKNRLNKQTFKDVKGFQIYRFKDDVSSVEFRKELKREDIDKVVKNKTPQKKSPSYTILTDKQSTNKKSKFGVEKNHFAFKFKDGLDVSDLDMMILDIIDIVVKKEGLDENDYIRIVLLDPNLDMSKGGSVSTPLRKIKNFTPGTLYDLMENISTSDEAWEISDETDFIVETIKNFTGMGNKDGFVGHKDDYAFFKKSVLTITNDDEMCMARAIVVGISLLQDKPNIITANKSLDRPSNIHYKRWESIRKGQNLQTEEALKLHENSGVSITGGCGLTEAVVFNDYLQNYYGFQLNIFDLQGKRIIYPDVKSASYCPVDKDHNIYILFNNDKKHYDCINNNQIAGFLEKSNFCHLCKKYYRREGQHSCKFKCNVCCQQVCESIHYFQDCELKKIKPAFSYNCEECCRFFATENCYDNHLKTYYKKNGEPISPVCDRIWKCPLCKATIPDDTKDRKLTHKCGEFKCSNCKEMVMPGHQCYMMPKSIKPFSDKYIFFDFESDISGECHTVMYSVSAYFDDEPEDYVIHYDINEFCKWVFCEEHKDYTFLAHNGKGYDFQFILKWVIENIVLIDPPSLIKAGSKIMTMRIPKFNISFVDSMNFVAGPLAAFPSIFGLKELAKGYFPHWFNTEDNWKYDGCIPPYDMFRPWNMKDNKKKDFDKWWCFMKLKNYRWIQHNEMKKYCISDVNILQKGMLKFRELFIKVSQIDPLRYITIAGVCMAIYRYHYVEPSFPQRFEEFEELLSNETCPDIKTEIREKFQSDTNLIIFEDKKFGCYTHELIAKIRPAFFGGRTNATKLLYHFKEGEEGRYADITSLYPTVQFYDKYPTGHPIIYDKEYINKFYKKVMVSIKKRRYFGFIKCSLDCPTKLYHPVLPHKTEKLCFDLRSKKGTWATNELYKALDKGYEITHIKEIIHYEESSTELFKGYVSQFLKLKEEASGYPAHIENYKGKVSKEVFDEMCEKHISDYFSKMGILLDKNNIERNEGMRAIAKLCLNSLWGKFGQRTNLGTAIIINTKEQLFKIIDNPHNDNINYFQLNDDAMEISYNLKQEYVPNDFTTNIGIAAFTTSSARMRLYEGLEHLNRQVLYFDTDSIVYRYNKNDIKNNKELLLGDLLGDWTDECDGFKMCGTFASGGPKNYVYKLEGKEIKGIRWDNKKNDLVKYKENNYDEYDYHIKVKGLNLHYEAKLLVNYNTVIKSIKSKYDNFENIVIPINQNGLRRDKYCNLVNNMLVKNYQVVYTKRRILPTDEDGTIDTVPFGYEL